MQRMLASLIVLAACSPTSDSDAGVCTTYVVPASTDLTTPVVSLRNDVMPIFAASCGFVSCHGTTTTANNGLYLGPQTGTADIAAVRTSLFAKATSISMPVVTPGDTGNSYLLHKIDADACKLCSGACGASMPSNSPVMDVARRDVIRRWIAQGAKDN